MSGAGGTDVVADGGWLVAAPAFLAAAFAVLAVLSAWRGARARAPTRHEARRRAGAALAGAEPPPRWTRLLDPLAFAVEPFVPARLARRFERIMRAAALDPRLAPAQLLAAQLAMASGGAAAFGIGWAALGAPGEGASGRWAAALLGAAAGAAAPVLRLRERAAARRRHAERQLPALLDLLVLALEAGQGVSSALALAAERLPHGALRDELERVIGEVRAGRGRVDALRAMALRLGLPAVAQLAATLSAGERQGASLGGLLRAQAAQCRHERYTRAERAAMQAPVKLLAPLALCVFPGTFAVLLVPVAVRLISEGVL